MNKGFRNLILVILFLFLFASLAIGDNYKNVRTDSGWDYSYDSGGFDSSSSWSSSSSSSWSGSDYSSHGWSTRSNNSSSSSGESLSAIELIASLIELIAIYGTIYFLFWAAGKDCKPNKNSDKQEYEEFMDNYDKVMQKLENNSKDSSVSDEVIKKYLPNETKEKLLNILYDKFIEIQYSWMEFNYDRLRELCTDELYNTYKAQLEILKQKNGKNVMNSFKLLDYDITDIKEENKIIIIKMSLKVSFIDYVMSTKTDNVVRGRKDWIITHKYELEFVVNNKVVDNKCPNCGALIKNNVSGKCEYCGSDIVITPKDYVLSKKKIV